MPARNSSMELSSPSNLEADGQNQAPRRKSGRAVKAPEHLSGYTSSSKRKRDTVAGTDVNDTSEDESIESDSDNSEELGDSRKRKAKKANISKGTTKRANPRGINGTLPLRSAAAKPKKAKKGARLTNATDGGLYTQIFAAEETLDDVAAEWLTRFDDHQANALTEIVNLLLRCSGCRIEVDAYDIEDPDNAANKLTEIQDEYQAQNVTEYPLIARSKGSVTFKKTLTGFFDSLVKSIAASSLLYTDPDLIENVQVWVACLSSASNRPFRHTATIVAFAIVSALCEIGKGLVDNKAKLLRQVEGEQRKKKINTKRVQDLQSQAGETEEHRVQLDAITKDWYDTIFVHRYRDVIPAVRVDSIVYLTDWIMTSPDQFFDGAHLRYLGWLLADEDKSVRQEVVKQLQRIYNDESKIAGLHQFTERFRPRMIEIATRDKETNIRAAAVELLEVLRNAGLLEPDDIDIIGRLVYDAEPVVRKAVVPFVVASIDEILVSKVDDLGGQEMLDDGLPALTDGDFEEPRREWLTFKTLGELLQSFDPENDSSTQSHAHSHNSLNDILVAAPTEVESRFSFATQVIFQRFPELAKWEALAGYLLFDHSHSLQDDSDVGDLEPKFKELCTLNDKEEIILLDVLITSVKVSLTEVVEDSKEKKAKKSKKEMQQVQEKQEQSSQRLAAIIPKLLNKFGAIAEAASAVLRLERMLNLEVFQELRQDSTIFAALLDDVKKQFMTHDNSSVLAQASAALNHANSFDGLAEVTAEKLQSLWDDSTYALISHCRGEELTVRGGIDGTSLDLIAGTVLRISSLARVSSCIEPLEKPQKYVPPKVQRKQHKDEPIAPLDLVFSLLDRGRPSSYIDAETNSAEDGLVTNVMQILLYYFLWHVHKLRKPKQMSSAESDIAKVARVRATVSSKLQHIIAERHGADAVRIAAAELLLDVHTVFVDRSANTEAINQLTAEGLASQQQTDILKVLAAAERDFATKSKRKLEGPGEDDDPEDLSDDEDSDSSSASDGDAQEVDDATAKRRRARAAQRKKELLMAEYRLCEFASKIVRAIIAGVIDRDPSATSTTPRSVIAYEGPVRKRLLKNRGRLGQNFKSVIEVLERSGLPKDATTSAENTRGAKGRKATAAKASSNANAAKSKQFVEDEDSEGDADVRMGDEIEDDDEDALRRNGLVANDDLDLDILPPATEESEAESVLGD